MSEGFSRVPRDLAGRIEGLEDVFDGEYERLVGDLRSLPPRDQLPPCQRCGEPLHVTGVFAAESGVAIALRLTCENGSAHNSGQTLVYVFEILTRELYPERRIPGTDGVQSVTLTVGAFRAALERAADGEAVETLLAEYRNSQHSDK